MTSGFDEALAASWAALDRGGHPFAAVMIDLDHFKAVNDHYGHEAGDRVLVQTAAILKDVCRKSDFVVRWGGEEFLEWRGAAIGL